MSIPPSPSKNSHSIRKKLRKNTSKRESNSSKKLNDKDLKRKGPQEKKGPNLIGTRVKLLWILRFLKSPKNYWKNLTRKSIDKAFRS